jgi:hypothetical protein
MGIRSFVEFLVKKIEEEETLNSNYRSSNEIESDIIDIIWNAYESYEKSND